ncbi:hypothetical protein [Streptomyces kebangsaanensis]|uniref:hypothetical protein n=1 Tax=Streptomyces kebangsaanensis TaxID=864058 RepID=UPI0009392895
MSGPRTAPAAPTVPEHRPSPGRDPETGAEAGTEAGAGGDSVGEVIRWSAFSCAVVPAVLLWYGTSLAGATGTALGLAAVTGVCRILLRRSERGAARLRGEERVPRRGRHHRTGTGTHRGGRRPGSATPVD